MEDPQTGKRRKGFQPELRSCEGESLEDDCLNLKRTF